ALASEGGPIVPWMVWIHGYHALLRAALAIKKRTARAREPSDERALALARDATEISGVHIDAVFVRAIARPASGRIVPIVYPRLSELHGRSATEIADVLFPRRRARR